MHPHEGRGPIGRGDSHRAAGSEFGFRAEVEVDFPAIVERKSRIVAASRGGVERSLEGNAGIELIRGWARFEAPERVTVDGLVLESERVIVASGVQPHIPDIPGLAEAGYLTNESVMDLEALPKRLVVLGGGPEGLEFGQAFRRFGSEVTIVQRNRRLAPKEDPEISSAIAEILEEEGIEILTGATPMRVERDGATVRVETDSGRIVEGDARWCRPGAGRTTSPSSESPKPGSRAMPSGGSRSTRSCGRRRRGCSRSATSWAASSTRTSPPTPPGSQSRTRSPASTAATRSAASPAIFTDPEIASFGLTAEEAAAQGRKVKVGRQEMRKVGRARAMGETRGFVKFVVDADTEEVLGMHVLAYHGAELLHEGVVAAAGAGTVAPLVDCICIHPTFSEGVKAAAGNLRPVEIPDATGDLPDEPRTLPTDIA